MGPQIVGFVLGSWATGLMAICSGGVTACKLSALRTSLRTPFFIIDFYFSKKKIELIYLVKVEISWKK